MPNAPNPALTDSELMERNGITLVRTDQYHVDGYRYSKLTDALAQAARRAAAAGDQG